MSRRIIRNFIKEEDLPEVLDFANSLPYYRDRDLPGAAGEAVRQGALKFTGKRTKSVHTICDIGTDIYNATGLRPTRLYFHWHDADPEWTPKIHADPAMSGVIYLIGGEGCGTEIDGVVEEFEVGKLVMYDGRTPHRPQGFPVDRLVITFFIGEE